MVVIKVVEVQFPAVHFQVIVNGTLLNTFMSKIAAERKKDQIIKAWNIDNIGKSTIKMVG